MKNEFDFKDFVMALLRRWRLFVVCILLFAVLGAGLRFFTLRGAGADDAGESDLLEFNRLESAQINLKAQLNSQMDYISNSILLNTDSKNLIANEIVFSLVSIKPLETQADAFLVQSDATAVSEALRGTVKGSEPAQSGIKALGIDLSSECISELVTIKKVENSTVILFRVVYPDEAGSQKLFNVYYDSILKAFENMSAFSSRYRLVVQAQQAYTYSDYSNSQLRENADSVVKSLNDNITKNQEKLDSMSGSAAVGSASKSVLNNYIKFGALGAAVGFIIAFFLTFFLDAMSPRLHSIREVKEELGIRILGTYSTKKEKRSK